MEIRTNEEVLEWYKNTLENGKVSEETIKREALKFFKTSPDAAKDKKRFKIEVEDFVTKHKNMLRKMEKNCSKESGGSVPADFRPDIEDDRERKKEFLRFARESIRSSKNYQDWLDADCTLFLPADVAKKKVLSLDDKKMVNKYSNAQTISRGGSLEPGSFCNRRILLHLEVSFVHLHLLSIFSALSVISLNAHLIHVLVMA